MAMSCKEIESGTPAVIHTDTNNTHGCDKHSNSILSLPIAGECQLRKHAVSASPEALPEHLRDIESDPVRIWSLHLSLFPSLFLYLLLTYSP